MEKKEAKAILHSRNLHRGLYDFEFLVGIIPELEEVLIKNNLGKPTIDFSDRKSVKLLNKALLLGYYKLDYWDVPSNYLVPPIPGRADYIHHLGDLLASSNKGKVPQGSTVKGYDIGTGTTCIYPLLGHKIYGWNFKASDIDHEVIQSAKENVKLNKLKDSIDVKIQKNRGDYFYGIISRSEKYSFSMCNPPFHNSKDDVEKGNARKWKSLKSGKKKLAYNFGGKHNELWVEGGERKFLLSMIDESQYYKDTFCWFTSLVSKESNLKALQQKLHDLRVNDVRITEMGQGNKRSRILAWTYQSKKQQKLWFEK